MSASHVLKRFQPAVAEWFAQSFDAPTAAQTKGWPPILEGKSTLLLAPTGSGKTLAAFLGAINKLMFSPEPRKQDRCRVLYVSPLKALAVDVERNLRAPIAGIAASATRRGDGYRLPSVAIRTGDTPANERAALLRHPPDVLITTPESLYLLLTSNSREMLRTVETVIVDEIHSMVSTKRGVHLFLSLERLEALRTSETPLQRIGLSATQRPLEEVAQLLGGGTVGAGERSRWKARPVEIVDAGSRKALQITVEVPVEDMSQLGEMEEEVPSGPAAGVATRRSIWPSIHPRLLELIKTHRSTMIFVNSRRLAERLANALNELAQEEIARAHHGSLAREQRVQIEDRLKQGLLPAIVATSSLELGLDIGAVDLVVQIEAPPSVASGMQRIGRAGHSVGEVSTGVMFPKYRGDLLACASVTTRMQEGRVEETFYPRNPLDVLAQQIAAMGAMDALAVDDVYQLVRRAAPYAELPRASFEGVLDMLSGRYPSDEFAELKPRITWDRVAGTLHARQGTRRVTIVNGGTIPDRGLYGVFLAADDGKHSKRVGELDEEMVLESRPGDVFLLGASSWRIEEITHDRVLVSPAPGEPGRMPFWHGDRPGRPLEFGRAIGELARSLVSMPKGSALQQLRARHGLDERAALNLMAYLEEQVQATGEVPSDRSVVVERYVDEIGDWRVCVMTPFGARVHAPWALAVMAQLQARSDAAVQMLWSDDGMVFRMPESDVAPDVELFFPAPDDVEDMLVRNLGQSSLFASRFRENAARALLLPRRHPGRRSPLWAQRKRSADLLAVASRYGSFPIILETYRECLRDVFDLGGLQEVLQQVQSRRLRVVTADSRKPSPFASSLLFSYVANFLYDGDAPLAERRAQALALDTSQLKELLGESELRELLDAEAIQEMERRLQRLDARHPVHHADGLHDMLLSLGDLTEREIVARCTREAEALKWMEELTAQRRIIAITVAGEKRYAAAEDAAKLRDALGVVPPRGLPQAFLEPTHDALLDVISRYARTHGPFTTEDVCKRFALGLSPVMTVLQRLADANRILEGEFVPGGRGREWCDAEVLRAIKRRSLARLRKEVEPVEPAALARFLVEWQGVSRRRQGLDALLSVVEQLQGCPIPASVLETDVLPARVENYRATDLDVLCSAGEVVWRGLESLGPNDGRVALYLTDHYRTLASPPGEAEGELAAKVRAVLAARGASFFSDLTLETGAFHNDLLRTLWDMVWAGEVTNDTLVPLRSMLHAAAPQPQKTRFRGRSFRSRRLGPPGSEGRWSLLPGLTSKISDTQRRVALVTTLLERYGVLTREMVAAEGIPGGFSAVYEVLKAMEESGRIRRGYFVAGLGATQFALPGADDRLRSVRDAPEQPQTVILAATDPANPYGSALAWPEKEEGRPARVAGAHVILSNGELAAFSRKAESRVLTFLPLEEPARSEHAKAIAQALAALADEGPRKLVFISDVDGVHPGQSPLAGPLAAAGFMSGARGYVRRPTPGGQVH
ncbi:MAG: DEAD/DEAH box helicase [Myxococcota bacterium]